MNHPNPAIVAQGAVRRIPRVALLLFCVAYILPGFIGREGWKTDDMASLGFMLELAHGSTNWFAPALLGVTPEYPGLLPYWIGAWAIQVAPAWIPPDFAVRIPFGVLMALTLVAVWYGTYYLARSPKAQPVAFAFGGEALPTDYARALADAGLLAFIGCLGLAQLSHETTPALTQVACAALFFYGVSALPYRRLPSTLSIMVGLAGLALSGAPVLASLFGLGAALIHLADRSSTDSPPANGSVRSWETLAIAAFTAGLAVITWKLDLWRWKIELPTSWRAELSGYFELLVWFTWPAGPLTLWTLWRWRHQLWNRSISRHLAMPAWIVGVVTISTFSTGSSDRNLLVALPAFATLAAFALPTLKRQVASLIDWFTLLFFSTCGVTIWIVWFAMKTGFPQQPAANVARLAPGFEPSFSLLAFGLAVLATLAWAWLVKWRVGRHRAAIWKSLVLPGCGAALCWLLLMTLWLPLLNYTQSYLPLVRQVTLALGKSPCAQVQNLRPGTIAAIGYYGQLKLETAGADSKCNWLLTGPEDNPQVPLDVNLSIWKLNTSAIHPADGNLSVLIFQRSR